MRGLLDKVFGAACVSVLTLSAASAAVLIPIIPVPGSTYTGVVGINDNNIVVGKYYTSDGVEHGYFGTLDGNYTTFDYLTGGTEPRAINNSGVITGFTNAQNLDPANWVEFERSPDGSIVTIKKGKKDLHGVAMGINSKGVFAGDYIDPKDGTTFGFYGQAGKYKQALVLAGNPAITLPRGINKSGAVVGYLRVDEDQDTPNNGFVLQNGATTIANYPDPSEVNTYVLSVNDRGVATGNWDQGGDTNFGFSLDIASNEFAPVTVPNASSVVVWGVNNAGLMAVDTNIGAYIYCPLKKKKCPSAGSEVTAAAPISVSRIRFPKRSYDCLGKCDAINVRKAESGALSGRALSSAPAAQH